VRETEERGSPIHWQSMEYKR